MANSGQLHEVEVDEVDVSHLSPLAHESHKKYMPTLQVAVFKVSEVAKNDLLITLIGRVAESKGYLVTTNKSVLFDDKSCPHVSLFHSSRPDLVLLQYV